MVGAGLGGCFVGWCLSTVLSILCLGVTVCDCLSRMGAEQLSMFRDGHGVRGGVRVRVRDGVRGWAIRTTARYMARTGTTWCCLGIVRMGYPLLLSSWF